MIKQILTRLIKVQNFISNGHLIYWRGKNRSQTELVCVNITALLHFGLTVVKHNLLLIPLGLLVLIQPYQ